MFWTTKEQGALGKNTFLSWTPLSRTHSYLRSNTQLELARLCKAWVRIDQAGAGSLLQITLVSK